MPSAEKIGKRWKGVARKMINGSQIKRTKNFPTKREALNWARETEANLGTDMDQSDLDKITLSQLIKRYRDEVSPKKKSFKSEVLRLNRFLRDFPHIARKPLSQFSKRDVAVWKEKRLETVKEATVAREWNNLSAVITYAQKDWGLPIRSNPFGESRRPPDGKSRHQRIVPADVQRLLEALQ